MAAPRRAAQAGSMCVCRSGAWKANFVTSAYFVFDNQVEVALW